MGLIADNYRRLRDEVPEHVEVVVAAKTRSAAEIAEAIEAGARVIGHNYVQEAVATREALPDEIAEQASWHMIGPMQRNKINAALPVVDVVQTVDSTRLAEALDRRATRPISVYVEVNIGGEGSKSGVAPGELVPLLESMAACVNLRVDGLMTMEPYCADPEDARPYLRRMRELFDAARALTLERVDLCVLSMGMSHSMGVAVEEGATMVRVGTAVFGPRA